MTFDYVTVPEGINVDADIYPLRVGREDERVLYGIDPAFIVEACMERRNALGYGGVEKYVLGRNVRHKLESAEDATSRNGIDFLTCVEPIRTLSGQSYIRGGGWLNRDFKFTDVRGITMDDWIIEFEEVYPGSTITDWASPVEHSNRIIGLDELKACYHDLARMSRALVDGNIKHSKCTSVMSGTDWLGENVNVKTNEYDEGYGFCTSSVNQSGSYPSGLGLAVGLYGMASLQKKKSDEGSDGGSDGGHDGSWSVEGFADPVYSFEGVDKYKSATALFLLNTYEDNGETYKHYYDIIAKPVGKDGSVSFDNSTAKSICLDNRSLKPVDDLNYVLSVNCMGVYLAVDLDLKTDISDIKWE